MTKNSTADMVLNALAPFKLKNEGPNQYRCNRPWSPASDSMGLTLKIKDGEHGTFFDHVLGEGGSLYQLAERLGISPNSGSPPGDTKRDYSGMADYARAHGVDKSVFIEAGWCEKRYAGKPALEFPTKSGTRWRLLDTRKSVFRSPRGYRASWYGLERAVDICWEVEHPLVICNGEPSVVVAQHYRLPACAVTGGERTKIPPALMAELKEAWQGEILIAPDCDETGQKMAVGVSDQLRKAGYVLRVLDFGAGKGFDLGDFCALHQEDSLSKLSELRKLEVRGEGDTQPVYTWFERDMTDIDNADRLTRLYSGTMEWVYEWGWLIWNEKKWERDRSARTSHFCKSAARSIYREAAAAAELGSDDRATKLAKWARQSSSRGRLEAMLKLAECELHTRPEQFDTDPYLLNVQNGILNLRRGELLPHDPAARMTRIAGAAFDPGAACPIWEEFLEQIFEGDQDRIGFIQRALGYSLTGSVDEQILLFLYGTGANGKSTFLQAIMGMLGDYARQSAPHLLMTGDRHPAEHADLYGARFVSAIEVEEGRRMAEVLVKQLTGGDRIKARYMHKNWFEFSPTHKIWLAANHKPIIRGTDHAIWRRFRLVPFTVTFAEDEQDHELLDRLKGEQSGILNWALQGCLEWQERGLQTPEIVNRSTSDYRGEMDLLASFIEDCCVAGLRYEVRAKYLYQAFTQWCEENGERIWTQRTVGLRLKERGFEKIRRSQGIIWLGIGLTGTPETEEVGGIEGRGVR